MLHGPRIFPCDKVKEDPRKYNQANGDQAQNHPDEVRVITPGYDVVHVSDKPSDGDQTDVHGQKAQITNQQNKMDGSRSLPAPEELWKKREPIINRGRHRYPGQHGERCHDENDSEV
jgi:hypothetical protein